MNRKEKNLETFLYLVFTLAFTVAVLMNCVGEGNHGLLWGW